MTDECDEPGRISPGSLDGPSTQSLDILLEVLADEQRRCLLAYLWNRSAVVESFEAVTDGLVAELKRRGMRPDHDVIRTNLRHRHLPKLADAGVLEYDSRSRTVRLYEHKRLELLYERVRPFET